jgi:hypothetical protein
VADGDDSGGVDAVVAEAVVRRDLVPATPGTTYSNSAVLARAKFRAAKFGRYSSCSASR